MIPVWACRCGVDYLIRSDVLIAMCSWPIFTGVNVSWSRYRSHVYTVPGVQSLHASTQREEEVTRTQTHSLDLINCVRIHSLHTEMYIYFLSQIQRFSTSATNSNLCNSNSISAHADLPLNKSVAAMCVCVCVCYEPGLTGSGVSLIHLVHQSWFLQPDAAPAAAAQKRGIHVNLITRTSWILMNLSLEWSY